MSTMVFSKVIYGAYYIKIPFRFLILKHKKKPLNILYSNILTVVLCHLFPYDFLVGTTLVFRLNELVILTKYQNEVRTQCTENVWVAITGTQIHKFHPFFGQPNICNFAFISINCCGDHAFSL